MPIEGKSLRAVSQQFCDQLNRLLATTISQSRLVLLNVQESPISISFREEGRGATAKLDTHFGEMGLYIGLLCGATKVRRKRVRLCIVSYKYSLTPNGSREPLWRWEYLKEWPSQDDQWCRHHVQGDVSISIGEADISLNDLHLPTGYVTIEDIIRFCIVDLGVESSSGNWHQILEESYQKFKLEPVRPS